MNYIEELKRQGREEGLQMAREMAREMGREEGRKEGRKEGRDEALLRITRVLLRHDVPWSIITDTTGIDEAKFRRLEQQFDVRG